MLGVKVMNQLEIYQRNNMETLKDSKSDYSEILCYACLGSGEYIWRNYRFKEIGRGLCSNCKGTGKCLIHNITGELHSKFKES